MALATRLRVRGALGTRSSVLLDLEGDGDLDIVTSEFCAAPQVQVSDLAQQSGIRFDSVTVSWPSGVAQTLEGPIETNQTLVVKEPEAS